MWLGFFRVVFPRLVSGSGVILLSLLTPAIFDIQSSSDFFVGISFLYLLSMVSKLGLDVLLIKQSATSGALISSQEITLFIIPVVMALLIMLVGLLLSAVFGFMASLYWVCYALPPFTLLGMLSALLRGKGADSASAYCEVGIVSFAVTLILLASCLFTVQLNIYVLFAIISWVVAISFLIYVLYVFRVELKPVRSFEWLRADLSSARYFLLSQLASYMSQWLPLYVIAAHDAALAVYYTLANRIAGVITFAGLTIDMFAAPRFAAAQAQKHTALVTFKKRMDMLSLYAILAMLPFVTTFSVAYGSSLDYELYYYVVSIFLILAYSIAVALGPNGYFLMMSGQEKSAYLATMYAFCAICFAALLSWFAGGVSWIPFVVAICIVLRAVGLRVIANASLASGYRGAALD